MAAPVSVVPDDLTWFTRFRMGLWPDFQDGLTFPTDARSLDQFFCQMTPGTGRTSPSSPRCRSPCTSATTSPASPPRLWRGTSGGVSSPWPTSSRDAVDRRGGDATVVHLPEVGITGNEHVMFQDTNTAQIAAHLARWMRSKG